MITRLTVIDDERKLLLGRDLNNVFKPGKVYQLTEILGEIIFKEIGDSGIPEKGYGSKNGDINEICMVGHHLLTKDELKNINKK